MARKESHRTKKEKGRQKLDSSCLQTNDELNQYCDTLHPINSHLVSQPASQPASKLGSQLYQEKKNPNLYLSLST